MPSPAANDEGCPGMKAPSAIGGVFQRLMSINQAMTLNLIKTMFRPIDFGHAEWQPFKMKGHSLNPGLESDP